MKIVTMNGDAMGADTVAFGGQKGRKAG
jgi:hypothetical protein